MTLSSIVADKANQGIGVPNGVPRSPHVAKGCGVALDFLGMRVCCHGTRRSSRRPIEGGISVDAVGCKPIPIFPRVLFSTDLLGIPCLPLRGEESTHDPKHTTEAGQ